MVKCKYVWLLDFNIFKSGWLDFGMVKNVWYFQGCLNTPLIFSTNEHRCKSPSYCEERRCFNMRMLPFQYTDSPYKDKTISRLSQLYHGNPYCYSHYENRKLDFILKRGPEFVAQWRKLCSPVSNGLRHSYIRCKDPISGRFAEFHHFHIYVYIYDAW